MSQADDIRWFVRANFIEPARARGDTSVSVRAGDVQKQMGLSDAIPAVCSAIGSDKFLVDASVSQISREGPQNSSTTVFAFAPNNNEQIDTESAEAELRRRYGTPDVDTKYLVSFDLSDKRAIALQRGNSIVQLWFEDSGAKIPVVEQRLYEANEGRHSNLPNRLTHQPAVSFREKGFPRPVRSVRVTSAAQLKFALDWYERFDFADEAANVMQQN